MNEDLKRHLTILKKILSPAFDELTIEMSPEAREELLEEWKEMNETMGLPKNKAAMTVSLLTIMNLLMAAEELESADGIRDYLSMYALVLLEGVVGDMGSGQKKA